MGKKIKSGIGLLFAIFFTILGFIGLALPIVPQTIFFLIAIILFSFVIPGFADFIERHLQKTPKILKTYHSQRSKFEKYFR